MTNITKARAIALIPGYYSNDEHMQFVEIIKNSKDANDYRDLPAKVACELGLTFQEWKWGFGQEDWDELTGKSKI